MNRCGLLSTVFVAAGAVIGGCVLAQQASETASTLVPQWFRVHTIDRIGTQLGQTALVDVDNDGDLDYIAGQAHREGSLPGTIWWWEYQAADRWVRHTLGEGDTDVGGDAYDVNGDGWVDFLAGSVLLLNTGNPREQAFTAHPVGTIYSHDSKFADVNGDGKMDLIANSDRSGLFWYEIPADVAWRWMQHVIAAAEQHKVHGGVSPRAVGDLDGDGDADVATARAWYENVDGEATRWAAHFTLDLGREDRYGVAVRTWTGDMDGDGDTDIVQSEADHSDGRIAWFENDGKGGFARHMIRDAGRREDFHSLAVADFDNDGDLDVFSGAAPLTESPDRRCYLWVNGAGRGGRPTPEKWTERFIASRPCHEAVAADVDGDGDVDIVSKPWTTGNEHFYLENLTADRGRK